MQSRAACRRVLGGGVLSRAGRERAPLCHKYRARFGGARIRSGGARARMCGRHPHGRAQAAALANRRRALRRPTASRAPTDAAAAPRPLARRGREKSRPWPHIPRRPDRLRPCSRRFRPISARAARSPLRDALDFPTSGLLRARPVPPLPALHITSPPPPRPFATDPPCRHR